MAAERIDRLTDHDLTVLQAATEQSWRACLRRGDHAAADEQRELLRELDGEVVWRRDRRALARRMAAGDSLAALALGFRVCEGR